ncbi:C40 family peptidase [Halomonas elongata]|uniref:C40 family peptidase n=1 Tax=Halomonas elongata TaxID=2746 RepID=UPI00186BA35F|nr:NlpC/P60 family protein [Halomonas elongata]MBW5802054.1 C40 family peptidase [Halomonas elongata]
MIDVTEYIGLPFEPGGRGPRYDCYGLLRRVYAERLGIALPEHAGYSATLTPATAAMIRAGLVDWQPVSEPEPWDAVLLLVDGRPNHIGLVLGDGWMLHTTRHKDACIESYRAPQWRDRIEGFYKWSS